MSTHDPAIAIVGPGNVGSAIARRLLAAGFSKGTLGVRAGSKIHLALVGGQGRDVAFKLLRRG
ncbi:hypothetical protein [Nannocystis pusilla]|uniref:Pyrroline-5-carboxylate reductase catalytic N-terminal domain-containing protein n=1 Tax=Nannocystis pusilla TaxID=889268 RepID=A0ABS7U2U3_9BACT|nr:hypothetical protein [Nannocystis pusilla]MBZ5714631.1 hypothetical protein [Nannocystis pusilla]